MDTRPANQSLPDEIPNINLWEVYDQRYAQADLHYEDLGRLADFFGRNMPVHLHDRFFQIHLVLQGQVRVNLDELSFEATGPMFFLTPPTIPHSFIIEDHAKGHVLTINQSLVWSVTQQLMEIDWQPDQLLKQPLCVELEPDNNPTAARLLQLFRLLSNEATGNARLHTQALNSLLQLILIDICRLAPNRRAEVKARKQDVRIFHRFNELIENHYAEHLSLHQYTQAIGVSEAQLNAICQRLAGLSSKQLINDRIMQEARRLVRYSGTPFAEIGYHLGFKDPAYFARYFRRNTGLSASQYRTQRDICNGND